MRPWTSQAEAPRVCRLAGRTLVTNVPFSELAAFEIGAEDVSGCGARGVPAESDDAVRCVYRGPGFIADQWREITSWSGRAGYRLSVNGVGEFLVDKRGELVYQSSEALDVPLAHVTETMLGPALTLALAIGGVWCLHGSAALLNGRAVAFLGESGKGKSTLAGWLERESQGSIVRMVDDILPVRRRAGSLEALPHFPQLKLPPAAQPVATMPERVPLDAIYILRRPQNGAEVAIQPLDKHEAVLALVRHTVASRLFAPDLLADHLDFCLHAAAHTPVRQLIYPLTPAAMPVVRAALEADLAMGDEHGRE